MNNAAHSDSAASRTPKQKWENFWYYHKWHVGIIGMILLFLFTLIYSLAARTVPDYQITLLSPNLRPAAALQALQQSLSPLGTDRNGDGKVLIEVQQYQLASSQNDLLTMNPQINMAGNAQLQADAQTGSTVIFLTDDFDALQDRHALFADVKNPYAPYPPMRKEGLYGIPWSDCTALNALELGTIPDENGRSIPVSSFFSDTVLCIRTITGTTLEQQESFCSYFQDSLSLFSALTGVSFS